MLVCNHRSCDNEADFKIYWPGRAPIALCEPHKDIAVNMATGMGFQLVVENLMAEKLTKIDPTNLDAPEDDV